MTIVSQASVSAATTISSAAWPLARWAVTGMPAASSGARAASIAASAASVLFACAISIGATTPTSPDSTGGWTFSRTASTGTQRPASATA
jgi:hypothetical protein